MIRLSDSQLDVPGFEDRQSRAQRAPPRVQSLPGLSTTSQNQCVRFGRTPADDPNYQLAFQFARRMVEEGYMTITGGADGIMRASQEGAGREHSFGVNIMLPFEQGANAVITDDPQTGHLQIFHPQTDVPERVARDCPLSGGSARMTRGFEIMTLVQTGKSDPKPIVCLQAPGCDYWNHWNSFITEQLLKRHLINPEDLAVHHRR